MKNYLTQNKTLKNKKGPAGTRTPASRAETCYSIHWTTGPYKNKARLHLNNLTFFQQYEKKDQTQINGNSIMGLGNNCFGSTSLWNN